MRKGLLVILSGPSGAGKGTILKRALESEPNLKCSISVTTRLPRDGEIDGVHYFFKSLDEYKKMLANSEFLETMEVYGNFYGTPISYVNKLIDEGNDVVLEIDIKGAMAVKNIVDDCVLVFLTPKDTETLKNRLIARGTENIESLNKRIEASVDELKRINEYDYLVINEQVEKCTKDILSIIDAERAKVYRNLEFVNTFMKD